MMPGLLVAAGAAILYFFSTPRGGILLATFLYILALIVNWA
jgi:hypothetical protein